jgi:hypothetical protein
MDEQWWWKRQYFPMAPNQRPLWHALKKVQGSELQALCGYTYDFLLTTPAWKDEAPKTKAIRCKKCDKKLAERATKEK